MRIISGKLKARRFTIPKGFPSRPTTDFAKEGLFNILENRTSLLDLDILDLCSGTGNISLEFLSREAGHVTAVDQNFNCIRHLYKTAKQFEVATNLTTIKSDILHFLDNCSQTFDLIFADPPYEYKEHYSIAQLVFEKKLLREDGILIIEHGRHTKLETLTNFKKTRTYGNVYFSFFSNKDEF